MRTASGGAQAVPLVCLEELRVRKNSELSNNVAHVRCEITIEGESRMDFDCKAEVSRELRGGNCKRTHP